ncbi:hypothetical protein [Roseivirga misakiensis]|uniref:Uncharacterized protein n=1 Tax=Roseivirga misakiensis TaxID=1563681 RepID=A0A1E5T6G3_9BACT|nr:hypothetical protein [Roseivirga misakiensis]OEK06950.1 hypothetical protein BFP71_04650 [Roseivirga misakiensis]
MAAIKIHYFKGLKAYYARFGRKWVVEENGQRTSFNSFEDMISEYPILMELPVMQVAALRRMRGKYKPAMKRKGKPPINVRITVVREKLVTCYYCSGKGEVFDGFVCPNCNGKKQFLVTTRGLG